MLYALTCAAICLVGSDGHAQVEAALWLRVDMPHGGCSLTARQDGSASIHFGAMPRWVRVAPGTFEFKELVNDLRARSYDQNARKSARFPVGSLSLPASKELLFIDDDKYIRLLLQRAWGARVLPSVQKESEDYKWVSEACSLQ